MTEKDSNGSYNHQARGVPFKPAESPDSRNDSRSHRDILKNLERIGGGSGGSSSSNSSSGNGNGGGGDLQRSHSDPTRSDDRSINSNDSFDFSIKSEINPPSPSPASHFLNSVLSVAQNAANSLGLKNNEITRTRSSSDPQRNNDEEDHDIINDNDGESIGTIGPYKKLDDVKIEPVRSTISTMGQGELSLATLGFVKDRPKVSSPLVNDLPTPDTLSPESAEQEFALPEFHKFKREPSSLGRSSSVKRNRSRKNTNDSSVERPPPRSISSSTITNSESHDTDDESHEDNQSGFPDILTNDHTNMTGFAYANPKRNREFHRLFKSVLPDDYLLDDFNCALSKEILIQGKMYVSERHICFNSNILGWVTNLVIAFDEIVAMEKKLTAGLFPNGILIQTLHARHSFASFVNRDSVFEFLQNIWRKASPHDQSRLDVNAIEMSDSDSSESTDKGDGDEEEGEEDDNGSFSSYGSSGELISDDMETDEEFGESARDVKGNIKDEPSGNNGDSNGNADSSPSAEGAAATSVGWPVPNDGPETHAPTELPALESNDQELSTSTINAPLGVVANILFGNDSTWYKKFLAENQKNFNLSKIPPFELENNLKTRHYDYIKPLSGPVGPKQTKCLCTDTIEKWDLENCVIVTTSTSTPDVPSGNAFLTKSKTGLCWGPDNTTKVVFSYHIEWSGKSWFKNPIEKGALDGQTRYSKDLIAEINLTLKSTKGKRKLSVPTTKPKKVRRKRKEKSHEVKAKEPESPSGVLGMIIGLLTDNPIPMIPLPTWSLLTVCFMLYAAISWIFFSATLPTEAERLQLMKVEEEYEMWKWFEDRGGVGFNKPMHNLHDGGVLQSPIFREGLGNDKSHGKTRSYSEQELFEAIKITEHRLSVLKERLNMK